MRSLSLALLGCLFAASVSEAVAQPAARLDVPVMAGGEEDLDACASSGRIVGLNPRGDGFLSVRSGPGGKPYREIDRLYNGNAVMVCDEQGPWLAVVYGRSADDDCGVGTPWPVRKPYGGPCRSGWVHSRYVRMVAG
ncbi:MAG TPA: SH3 domain-containing protein [Microvirga sp.]|jgi:Bacterial SH3 domain|nr:SH3 domain-containing protein [Microvirga sp.]